MEFEKSLAKQIVDERLVLAKLEAAAVTVRVRIATLESVQTNLKANGDADDVAEDSK